MDQTKLKQQLLEMLAEVEQDSEIDDQLKEKLKDLISATAVDPTPGNIDALATVCEQMGASNKYRLAMTVLQNLKEDDAMENDQPDTAEENK